MTAVEWLLQELKEYSTTPSYAQDSFILKIPKEDMVKMINQAKETEKEQIIKAWELRATPYPMEGMGYSIIDATGEQYYNERYGQERK